MENRCSAVISGYWGSNFLRTRQCKCAATVTRDDLKFCWRHDPETAEAREKAQKEKSRLAWEAKRPLKLAMYAASLRIKASRKGAKS